MKTVLSLLISLFITGTALAGNYEQAMQKKLSEMKDARTPESLTALAQGFDRIAQAEADKWLPRYYSALCYIWAGFNAKEDKDQLLDEAQSRITEAMNIEKNSELQALQGYLYMAKLTVDPMTRGPQYTPMVHQALGMAIQMDPENPRAYMIMAQIQMGTAKFFGKGEKEACEVALTAHQKYESADNADPLMPSWGSNTAKEMAEGCLATTAENEQK